MKCLNRILLSRNRYLECVFQIVAAIALLILGCGEGRGVFLFLGTWLLFSIGATFKTSSIAKRVGERFMGQMHAASHSLDYSWFRGKRTHGAPY